MRAELHYDGIEERFELPECDIYGISVMSQDGRLHMDAVNFENLYSDFWEEADVVLQKIERVTTDGITVCIFCWTASFLTFIPEIMAGYPGMKYIEVRNGNLAVELIC